MKKTPNKETMYGMMLNALMQIQDGTPLDEVNVNPDMREYDDYSLDELVDMARYLATAKPRSEVMCACPKCGGTAILYTDGLSYFAACAQCDWGSDPSREASCVADAVADWNADCFKASAKDII